MTQQLIGLIRTMRLKQWDKNGFVVVPLIFDHKLFDLNHVTSIVLGFFLLSLTSSAVYIMNDLVDIERDRAHPTKRNRPIASGQLSRGVALAAAIIIVLAVLPLAYLLKPMLVAVIVAYLALQIAYSFKLKHMVVIDVMAIAAGFVLRVAAGVVLVGPVVRFSPWLYLFTTMLALFLGFGKRRQEILLLQDKANTSRKILAEYNIALLDELIVIVSATTVLTYALYTFSAEGLPPDHTMMLTIPFVVYIIFRYLYLIHVRGEGGAPDEVLLTDKPLLAAVILGGISIILILYVFK
jgi:4-hydroxybenzoate polyprenyltransferase